MPGIPRIQVMWNDSRDQWVVDGRYGPNMARTFHNTKKQAIKKARKTAKSKKVALFVETKKGVASKRADYRNSNADSSGRSTSIFDNLGL